MKDVIRRVWEVVPRDIETHVLDIFVHQERVDARAPADAPGDLLLTDTPFDLGFDDRAQGGIIPTIERFRCRERAAYTGKQLAGQLDIAGLTSGQSCPIRQAGLFQAGGEIVEHTRDLQKLGAIFLLVAAQIAGIDPLASDHVHRPAIAQRAQVGRNERPVEEPARCIASDGVAETLSPDVQRPVVDRRVESLPAVEGGVEIGFKNLIVRGCGSAEQFLRLGCRVFIVGAHDGVVGVGVEWAAVPPEVTDGVSSGDLFAVAEQVQDFVRVGQVVTDWIPDLGLADLAQDHHRTILLLRLGRGRQEPLAGLDEVYPRLVEDHRPGLALLPAVVRDRHANADARMQLLHESLNGRHALRFVLVPDGEVELEVGLH